jgi:hypothetical protein
LKYKSFTSVALPQEQLLDGKEPKAEMSENPLEQFLSQALQASDLFQQ